MDKKLYHRGNGEVVQPKWRKPVRNKFSQSEAEMQMWEQELKEETKNWNEHICSLPIYAYCDPSNPVGWVEGEEVYQVRGNILGDWTIAGLDIWESVDDRYRRIWIEPKPAQPDLREAPIWYTKDEMFRWLVRNNYSKEIATELSQKWADDLQGAFAKGFDKAAREARQMSERSNKEQQPQPDFQREAEELYPDFGWDSAGSAKRERLAHIKARQMSAGEVEELRRENDRLKADNMTHEYNEAEAQRFAPEYERQIREDEADKWREQVRKLREGVEELIATIERNAVDNNTDIVNVKLWAKSWREEILNQPQ